MKNPRLLLLILPLIVGAFYLHSLVSWRPQKLFVGTTRISQLVFSSDGKTLLVGQNSLSKGPQLTALDATHGFVAAWTYKGHNDFVKPQFFLGGSRVLVREPETGPAGVLDATTGRQIQSYGMRQAAFISTDGKWLASRGQDSVYLESTTGKKPLWKPDGVKIPVSPGESISSGPAISPDSGTLAVQVTEFYRTRLDFYDTLTGKKTDVWPDFPSRVFGQGIQWSRNGRYLLSTWYYPMRPSGSQISWSLWRVSDHRKLADTSFPPSETIPGFEVEDNGRVLSHWTDAQALLSEPTTTASKSKPILNLPGEIITATTLSPDGSHLMAGTASGRVYSQRLK